MAQSQQFSSWAAFSGGAVLGAFAARMLPPLVTQFSGPAQFAMGRDPLDLLARDHRLVLGALDTLLETPNDASARRTAMFLHIKRSLAAHSLAEEDIVYPILYARAKEEDEARKLYDDHAEIKIHLWRLETEAKNTAHWLDIARSLRDLVAEHARQEEQIEFPKVRQAIGDTERGQLLGSVMREKAMIL